MRAKKIIAVVLAAAAMLLVLSGCGKLNTAVKQRGPYEGVGYVMSVPDGWMRNERSERILFLKKDYPETASYIAVSTTEESQVEQLMKDKDDISEYVVKTFDEQLGEGTNTEITAYEKINVNDNDCVHVVTKFNRNDKEFTHDQYTFDTSKGSVTINYVSVSGEDFSKEYKESLDSIVIK